MVNHLSLSLTILLMTWVCQGSMADQSMAVRGDARDSATLASGSDERFTCTTVSSVLCSTLVPSEVCTLAVSLDVIVAACVIESTRE